jgi:Ca2+/H+ antiporter
LRRNPLLGLLVFVPAVFAAARLKPEAHTLLFVLSVLAIVPLAALLSHATESVAAKTGDAAGGLLNATLGNLTELLIALTALAAGLALATLAGVTVLVALVSEVFVESVQKAAEDLGMTPAFVGFIVVALVGGAAAMASAFSGARRNRLDLSVGIALGSASQIALFVAPVLVLLCQLIHPSPMDLQFWPGAVVMVLIATLTAAFVTNGGRSTWFVGVLVLMVYLIFAMTLYLLPPRAV